MKKNVVKLLAKLGVIVVERKVISSLSYALMLHPGNTWPYSLEITDEASRVFGKEYYVLVRKNR